LLRGKWLRRCGDGRGHQLSLQDNTREEADGCADA
jgi:hypothetical protein